MAMEFRKTSFSPKFYMLFTVVLYLNVYPCVSYISFIFGDSLVDAGNNDYIFTLSKADSPPYGIDFIPSGGKPTGRFTNGRTISDIIGQVLGAKTFPPPFLAPTTRGDAIFRGVNYASGASGILEETGTLFVGRVPLREQINYFKQNRAYMVTTLGEDGTNEFLKRSIFSVTTGSNDVLNYLEPSVPFLWEGKVSSTNMQDFMVFNLTLQLRRLHELGARKFLVVGVGPLGCIPIVRALKLVPDERCSLHANKLIQGYNKKLKAMLNRLNQELGPESIFVYGNSYDIFFRILENYREYGFENGNDPCCGGAFPPFICFRGQDAKTSSFMCQDRSKYVFWDAYHPTEAANVIVAETLLDGDETVSTPINVRELYNYNS
ncbi:hypothetical protein GIB67_000957 [Kingdonia uniflora]|uniref:GDSL esterase/lipase n=1 Tax=Kingdonia uniflora TaxID=39325 RepID=A0A7J7MG49_9MAGN|nr:hypothetical protein GIB67_000957 [Kingdonia uniflora]